MGDYMCDRCGYNTNLKINLQNHLKRKHICSPVLSNVDREELLNRLVKKPALECPNCKVILKNKVAKCRHLKTCNPIITNLVEKINKLEKEIQNLNKENKKIVQQNTNCNNTTTNNTYNITLNNFCCENTKYLSPRLLVSCLVDMDIPRLLEQIHFDPAHPENHTVKIKNINKKLLQYYEDGRWKIEQSDKVLEDMINCSGYRILKAFYENNSEIVNQEAVDYVGDDSAEKLLLDIDKWFKKLEKEDEKTFKDLKNRIFLVVMNGSAIICERK